MSSVVEPSTIVDVPVDVVVVEPLRDEVAEGFGMGVQLGRVNVPLKLPEPPWTMQLVVVSCVILKVRSQRENEMSEFKDAR